MALARKNNAAPQFEDAENVIDNTADQAAQAEQVEQAEPALTQPEPAAKSEQAEPAPTQPVTAEPAQEPTQPEQPAATTAVAPAQTNTAVAAPAFKGLKRAAGLVPISNGFRNVFEELKNAIPIDAVRSFGLGTHPKLSADLGGLILDDEVVGNTVIIDIESYNDRWMVVPGDDDDEAKKVVRTSYDKVTLELADDDEDLTVQEYLEAVKADWPKAKLREYGDLWGLIYSTENQGVIEASQRKLVQIQLSPQSLKKWRAFMTNQSMAANNGVEVSTRIKITCQRGEFNKKKFGYMEIEAVAV